MMTGSGTAWKKKKKEEPEPLLKKEKDVEEEEGGKKPEEPKVPRRSPPAGSVYVDATDQIAGRLCSKVAKLIIRGDRVVVVNAERALISGARKSVINEWKETLEISSRVNPIYGPVHPRRPDTILTRMVRGMVPRRKPKGAAAMKRLRIHIGVPEELKNFEFTKFDDAQATRPVPVYVSVRELSKNLGWSG